MSIASEITRLQGVKSDILTAIADKGVEVPVDSMLDDCPDLIDSISGGGGGLNKVVKAQQRIGGGVISVDLENSILSKSDDYRQWVLFFANNPHFENYNKVKLCFRFNKKLSSGIYAQIIGENASFWCQPCIWFTNQTTLNIGIPSGNDNWDNLIQFNNVSINTFHKICIEIDNNTKTCIATLYDADNNIEGQQTVTFTNIVYRDCTAIIGLCHDDATDHTFVGDIDLAQSYIQADDTVLW